MSRDLHVGTSDKVYGFWHEVVGERQVRTVLHAEFGLAEENLVLMGFTDGTYEVGVGESMRPYDVVYVGNDSEAAYAAWAGKLADLAGPIEEPTPEELQEIEDSRWMEKGVDLDEEDGVDKIDRRDIGIVNKYFVDTIIDDDLDDCL
jgi:hypothetical protein